MNVFGRSSQGEENRPLGMGLALFIAVYFVATVCFLLLK
jgi:hypothetical protein